MWGLNVWLRGLAGIEESIRCGVFAICEPNTVEAMSLKATFMFYITSKLMDPEEFHAVSFYALWDPDIDMEDPKDLGVPE